MKSAPCRHVFLGAVLASSLATAPAMLAAPRKPPKNPAKITIDVAPKAVSPGGAAEVKLTLAPIDGVKIARYPRIKLDVPAREGLVDRAGASIGSEKPPPPDQLATNYWKEVDPVLLTLTVDPAAASGDHEVDAKLTYYFCVSGDFCAPARVPVKIPLAVE